MSAERTYRYATDLVGPEPRRTLSGLEIRERIRDGRLPITPIPDVLAFRLVDVAAASVGCVGTPQPFTFNMHGTLDGGWSAAAEGELHHPVGRLVAHGLTTCLLLPVDGTR